MEEEKLCFWMKERDKEVKWRKTETRWKKKKRENEKKQEGK